MIKYNMKIFFTKILDEETKVKSKTKRIEAENLIKNRKK